MSRQQDSFQLGKKAGKKSNQLSEYTGVNNNLWT